MTLPAPLGDRVSRKAANFFCELRKERKLGIAVLGPGLDNPCEPGAQKRRQIHDALRQDGHAPFFPEDIVSLDATEPLLEERDILRRDSVDWIVVLHTRQSLGTVLEIGNSTDIPEIMSKTTILFPYDLYYYDSGLVAKTVRGSWSDPMPYTEEQLVSCSVVSECRGMAVERMQANSRLNLPPDDLPIL